MYPCRDGWDCFIAKEKLNMETTYFSINNKRHVYIKVGSWNLNDGEHPPKIPAVIWKEALKCGTYSIPKLRISSVALRFASNIGRLFSTIECTPSESLASSASSTVTDCESESLSEETDDCSNKFSSMDTKE